MSDSPEEDDRPVFRWKISRTGDALAPSGAARPVFGVARWGGWFVTVGVVATLCGLFLMLGVGLGLPPARSLDRTRGFVALVAVAGVCGAIGVHLGTRVAFRLTDVERTRPRLVLASAAGTVGMVIGFVLPMLLGHGLASMSPLLATAGAGLGALAGRGLAEMTSGGRPRRKR